MSFFKNNLKQDILTGLIGWWRLDEGTGNIARDSVKTGNHGVLNLGGSSFNSMWIIGQNGNHGLNFDGDGNYVDCGVSSLFNFTGSDFSIVFWYKRSGNAISSTPICRGLQPSDGWYIVFDAAHGEVILITNNISTGYTYTEGTSHLAEGVWYHIVCVLTSNIGKIYINGVEETYSSQPIMSVPTTSNRHLYIGRYEVFGSSISAYIDDVRIYNRALRLEETRILFNIGG